MSLKLAFAGAGYIANIHAQAAQNQPNVELVAVVEKFLDKSEAFAEKFPHLPMTKAMKDKVDRFRRVTIGAKAANLQGKNPFLSSVKSWEKIEEKT